jgi:hypothetical protein
MAVTALTATTQAAAINYNYTTSGSSDWSSVSNSTYFYDLVDRLPRYKNSGGTVLEVFSSGGGVTTVPQANIIYIDATNGSDNGDSGRGNIDKPYAFDIKIFGDKGYHYEGSISSFEGVIPNFMIQVNEDKKIFVNIVCKFKDSNNNYLH